MTALPPRCLLGRPCSGLGARFVQPPGMHACPGFETTWKEYGVHVNKIDGHGIVPPPRTSKNMLPLLRTGALSSYVSRLPARYMILALRYILPRSVRVGYRLRGMENVIRAIEDVGRVCDMGVRGIICTRRRVCCKVMDELRKAGDLPSVFSEDQAVPLIWVPAAAASFKLFEKLGADTVTPSATTTLEILAALRIDRTY